MCVLEVCELEYLSVFLVVNVRKTGMGIKMGSFHQQFSLKCSNLKFPGVVSCLPT